MNVGKTIEAVTSSVMMVIHILGVVHDSNKTVQVCISFIPQNQTQMCWYNNMVWEYDEWCWLELIERVHCSVVDGKQKHSLVCTSTHKNSNTNREWRKNFVIEFLNFVSSHFIQCFSLKFSWLLLSIGVCQKMFNDKSWSIPGQTLSRGHFLLAHVSTSLFHPSHFIHSWQFWNWVWDKQIGVYMCPHCTWYHHIIKVLFFGVCFGPSPYAHSLLMNHSSSTSTHLSFLG